MSDALEDLLIRHVTLGTMPEAVAVLAEPGAEPEIVAVASGAPRCSRRTHRYTGR